MSNDEYTKIQQKCLSDMIQASSSIPAEEGGSISVIQLSTAQQMACKVFRSFDSVIEDVAILKLEILLKDKRIKELEAELHGTRRHSHEITSHNPNGSTTTAILLADEDNQDGWSF